jgi:glycosyltransferase involved in cell wall biosynthesis
MRTIRIPRLLRKQPVEIGPSFAKALYDFWLFAWAAALMVRHRYDVVHAHEESAFFAVFLARLFRARFIYDMHSSLPEQLTHFPQGRFAPLVGLFRAMESMCLKRSDVVVTISPALAEYARSRMSHPGRHILIENSVVAEVRLRGEQSVERDPPLAWLDECVDRGDRIIAYAGTLEPYQGLDLLLEAFAALIAEGPKARLLIIGGSPEQVEHYRALASRLSVDGYCLLTGAMRQRRVRRLLSQVDVLVSPRLGGTNTPLKVYEQLASGVPLVATRVLAHTQVLDDDISVLVEPTPLELAAGLRRVLADPSASREMASRAKAVYAERYGWDVYFQKTGRMMSRLRSAGGVLRAGNEVGETEAVAKRAS